jgi:hypothetical protein
MLYELDALTAFVYPRIIRGIWKREVSCVTDLKKLAQLCVQATEFSADCILIIESGRSDLHGTVSRTCLESGARIVSK